MRLGVSGRGITEAARAAGPWGAMDGMGVGKGVLRSCWGLGPPSAPKPNPVSPPHPPLGSPKSLPHPSLGLVWGEGAGRGSLGSGKVCPCASLSSQVPELTLEGPGSPWAKVEQEEACLAHTWESPGEAE